MNKYAGKFQMASFNKNSMTDIMCNPKKKVGLKNKNTELFLQVCIIEDIIKSGCVITQQGFH